MIGISVSSYSLGLEMKMGSSLCSEIGYHYTARENYQEFGSRSGPS